MNIAHIRTKGDFVVSVHYHEWQGKTDCFAVINHAFLSHDDGLVDSTELNLQTDVQKQHILSLLENLSGFYYGGNVAFSYEEAEQMDKEFAEWEC